MKYVGLVNTDVVARTVNLYLKRSGGTSRRIMPKDMSMNAGDSYEKNSTISLSIGDLLEGDASAATIVDYTITGIERT